MIDPDLLPTPDTSVESGPYGPQGKLRWRSPEEAIREALEDEVAGLRAMTSGALADVLTLARFGAWAAGEFRSTMHDVEGGEAQDAMVRCGVLVKFEATEPCGEICVCAEYGDFPQDCYKFPPGVAQIVKECGK